MSIVARFRLAVTRGTLWDHWVLAAIVYTFIGLAVTVWCAFVSVDITMKAILVTFMCYLWALALLVTAQIGPRWLTTSQ